MRHQVFGKKLGRDINSRRALLSNLASSLLENGQVITTTAKARFVKPYVEKLITAAKKNRLFKNRKIASQINRGAFLKLVKEIGPHYAKREGGYTRIIKLSRRRGDAAPMAKIELLPLDKIKTQKAEAKKEEKRNTKDRKKVLKKLSSSEKYLENQSLLRKKSQRNEKH